MPGWGMNDGKKWTKKITEGSTCVPGEQLKPIANPTVADNTRPPNDPYVIGYNEGIAFQKEREANIRKLDAESDEEFLHCKIKVKKGEL